MVASARHRFNSRNLKHLHLNAVRKEEQERNEEGENEPTRSLPLKCAVKDRKKHLCGPPQSLQRKCLVHHQTSDDTEQQHGQNAQIRADQSAAHRKEHNTDHASRRAADRGCVCPTTFEPGNGNFLSRYNHRIVSQAFVQPYTVGAHRNIGPQGHYEHCAVNLSYHELADTSFATGPTALEDLKVTESQESYEGSTSTGFGPVRGAALLEGD